MVPNVDKKGPRLTLIRQLVILELVHFVYDPSLLLYPEDVILRGSFLYAPWNSIGHRLCTCPTISLEDYLDYLAFRARIDAQP